MCFVCFRSNARQGGGPRVPRTLREHDRDPRAGGDLHLRRQPSGALQGQSQGHIHVVIKLYTHNLFDYDCFILFKILVCVLT